MYYNVKLYVIIKSNYIIFIGFTEQQFDKILNLAIPTSTYLVLVYLAFIIVTALSRAVFNVKGTQKKLLSTIVTLFYSAIVAFIFAISIVSYMFIPSFLNLKMSFLNLFLKFFRFPIQHLYLLK